MAPPQDRRRYPHAVRPRRRGRRVGQRGHAGAFQRCELDRRDRRRRRHARSGRLDAERAGRHAQRGRGRERHARCLDELRALRRHDGGDGARRGQRDVHARRRHPVGQRQRLQGVQPDGRPDVGRGQRPGLHPVGGHRVGQREHDFLPAVGRPHQRGGQRAHGAAHRRHAVGHGHGDDALGRAGRCRVRRAARRRAAGQVRRGRGAARRSEHLYRGDDRRCGHARGRGLDGLEHGDGERRRPGRPWRGAARHRGGHGGRTGHAGAGR